MSSQAIAPGKRANSRVQSRFQRLWAEAESAAHENEQLDTELDALVQRVVREIGKAETALGETMRQAVHRQLDFAAKKSLSQWQRAELGEWIDEHLNRLMDLGELDETLQNRLAVLRAQEMGFELDEDSELSPVEQLRMHMDQMALEGIAQPDDEYADDDEDWFDDEVPVCDADFQKDEEELAELLKRLREEFAEQQEASPEPDTNAGSPVVTFDDAVFKRLFRQTAAALHPDREIDPDRQREKHELMSELLHARKKRDLITVLRLHDQHASAESDLSAKDEQELEEVLLAYLSQQRESMESIVHRSPVHRWVFQEFYHKNPATVGRRLKAHIGKIDEQRDSLSLFVTHVKTLKMLKELLAERYEQHRFGGAWFY